MAYAVIQTGGKQYRVSEGDTVSVEKLPLEEGAETVFEEVLLYRDDKEVKVGKPVLAGAKVKAKVLSQFRDPKVIAFKFKRRKGYHRTIGHRRERTKLIIEKIQA